MNWNGLTKEQLEDYEIFFKRVNEIYGEVENHHPVVVEKLKLTFNPRRLTTEALVRTNRHFFTLLNYILKCLMTNFVGKVLIEGKFDTKDVAWSNYLTDVVANSDYKKFDGMVKMIMDGSVDQEKALLLYLENCFKLGKLIYGTHTCPEATMTCLVFTYSGKHAHFLEDSHGGYALAAKDFKLRLREWKTRSALNMAA